MRLTIIIVRPATELTCYVLLTPISMNIAVLSQRPGREFNYPSPFRGEVQNAWSYTSTPPVYLHGVDRDNSTCPRPYKITVPALLGVAHAEVLKTSLGRGNN